MFSFAIILIFQIASSSALPNDHLNYLAMRQADIPGACADQCIPINSIIASQCTVGKCCTNVFANGYADCVRCFGQAIEITNFAPFQTAIDTLFAACSRAGQPIPKLTLPGQDANRVIASTVATTTRVSTASVPPGTASASNSGTAPSSSALLGSSAPAVTPTQATPPSASATVPFSVPLSSISMSSPNTISSGAAAVTGALPTPSTSGANRHGCFMYNKVSAILLVFVGFWLYAL
ncbi:hypothetical protein AB1N83_002753 [Pleurotus pulmonarius]